MSGYFDVLARDLERAADSYYGDRAGHTNRVTPRLRRLANQIGGRGPVVAIVVTVAAGGAAVAATMPFGHASHRLAGRVPEAALVSPGRLPTVGGAVSAPSLPKGIRYAVAVTPNLEPGTAGWCGKPYFFIPGRPHPMSEGSACASATGHEPGVIGGGEPLTNLTPETANPTASHRHSGKQYLEHLKLEIYFHQVDLSWHIVHAGVRAIRIAGVTHETFPNHDLPAGWRSLVVFTKGSLFRRTDIDAKGRPLPEASLSPTALKVNSDLRRIPIKHVAPQDAQDGVCDLGPVRLSGLTSSWEATATEAPAFGSKVESGALFSCARAWYAFPKSHAVYSAALLLSAEDPSRTAPAPPGLTTSPISGDYEEDADLADQMTARRIDNAWLIIEGPNPKIRRQLSQAIKATGTNLR